MKKGLLASNPMDTLHSSQTTRRNWSGFDGSVRQPGEERRHRARGLFQRQGGYPDCEQGIPGIRAGDPRPPQSPGREPREGPRGAALHPGRPARLRSALHDCAASIKLAANVDLDDVAHMRPHEGVGIGLLQRHSVQEAFSSISL